jgi:hypothetical protein
MTPEKSTKRASGNWADRRLKQEGGMH